MRFLGSPILILVAALQASTLYAQSGTTCDVPATCGIDDLMPLIGQCVEPLPAGVVEPLFTNLGNYRHPIAAQGRNAEKAQQYFDQGLRLWYAFNMPESLQSFAQAAKFDEEAPMPYWGIALAAGPDVNYPNVPCPSLKLCYLAAHTAVHKANARAIKAGVTNDDVRQLAAALQSDQLETAREVLDRYRDNPASVAAIRELGYALAITQRYSCEPTACPKCGLDAKYRVEAEQTLAFSRAMNLNYQLFPDDPDAAVLYAFSLMQLHPWDWWTPEKNPTPEIEAAIDVLESVLAEHIDHPGANHLYIHAVEEGPAAWVEKALPNARRLPELMPGAGHFQHMPSHIYLNLGRYDLATQANQRAVAADREYIEAVSRFHPVARYPLHYLGHNLHFLATTQAAQGQQSEAFATARELVEVVEEFARGFNARHNSDHVSNEADRFLAVPITVALQFDFAHWKEVEQSIRAARDKVRKGLTEANADNADLPVVSTMLAYGNTLHAIKRQDWVNALECAREFKRLAQTTNASLQTNSAEAMFQVAGYVIFARAAQAMRGTAESHTFLPQLKDVLGIVTNGENTPEAECVAAWQSAVKLQDALHYNDPPEWYFPARQSLGAAYYVQQRFSEAEETFREDLEMNPGNPRSTYGLIMSLRKQDKPVDPTLEEQFRKLWSNETPPSLNTM